MGILIKNGTVVSATGSEKLDVLMEGETIARVGAGISEAGHEVVDATGLLVMPGGIDVHTHLDMPFGGTTSADDYTTGTQAAAIGGTTSLIDFALQNQKGTLREAFDIWREKSRGKACVDYSLHMAVTNLHGEGGAETLGEMEEMVAEGITSFKLFMAYPNVLMVNDELMFRVMQKAAALNALCLIHAENGSAIDVVVSQMIAEGKTAPHYHALSRSAKAEAEATHRAIALADMAGAAVYIVHLSNEDALAALKFMQGRGAKALAETCTQYLVLSIEDQMLGRGGVCIYASAARKVEPAAAVGGAEGRIVKCGFDGPLPVYDGAEGAGEGRLQEDSEWRAGGREQAATVVALRRERREDYA
jgi:dihydropyrimidinase